MNIVGVVLAGGLSSRMKIDKADLVWEGNSLIDHTRKTLIEAGCREVLVSNNKHPTYIKDRYLNSGPLAGIDACLNFIKSSEVVTDFLLVMPVDMPLMRSSLLKKLIAQAEMNTICFYNLGRFPLLLPVNETLSLILKQSLESHQEGKALSIRNLLKSFECNIVDLDKDQHDLFQNCNTMQQWKNLNTMRIES